MGEDIISFCTQYMRFAIVIFFFCAVLHSIPVFSYAQDSNKEDLVKAVLLYNFAKFTDWPVKVFSGQSGPIFFSATGVSMAKILGLFEGKQVKKRSIKFRDFNSNPQYFSHILFISSSDHKSVDQILSKIANKAILTISDIPNFIHKGGMIGLVKKDDRIRFEINFDATRKAGLRISSQMLLLATVVLRDQAEVK